MNYVDVIDINELVNLMDLQEIINKLDFLINELKKQNNRQLENDLTKEFRKMVNNYRKSFKRNYPNIKNLCIYPEDKPFLYLCSIIDELKIEAKSKFELIACLEMGKELYHSEFSANRKKHISFEEEISILYLAQEKFRFLDVLSNSDKFFNLYNLPFVGNFDDCNIMAREYPKHMFFEFSIYDQDNIDDNIRMYTSLLGRILNFALVDNLYEGPYGMMRTLNSLGIEFSEKEKDGGPLIFSNIFIVALFNNTKYENQLLSDNEKELGLFCTKYVDDTINLLVDFKEKDNSVELDSNDDCPCESGKKYGDCCGRKRLKWVKRNGAIFKEIPLDDKVVKSLKVLEEDTKRVLGRTLKKNEKIFRYSVGPDIEISEIIRLMRKCNIPLDKMYATYKNEIMLNEVNIDLVPDYELDNWKEAIDEYNELISNIPEGSMSYIEYITDLNINLADLWKTYLSDSLMLFNLFINDIKDDYFLSKNFEINDINDFLVFCARRVSKNVKALYETLNNNHYEVSMSIIRMLYEDLININVYIKNRDMFNKHIMPMILIDKGVYQKLVDDKGNVSNKTAINPKTNEKINYSITLKDLSKKADYNYWLLYDELFKDLSSYTHLNIGSRKSYFSNSDPLFEIDSCNVAGLLGLFFVNQIIFEFSKLEKLSVFAYRDLLYFSDKVKEELYGAFIEMMRVDEGKGENKLFEILLNCVKDFEVLK